MISREEANLWLLRTNDDDGELEQYYIRRGKILDSLSGIGAYDAERVRGGSDSNPTESKNIEYSLLCERIEKLERKIANENARTIDVINKVKDSKLRGMLFARYINHFSWNKVGEMYHYSRSGSFNYRNASLDAVRQFIPKEAMITDRNPKVWTELD